MNDTTSPVLLIRLLFRMSLGLRYLCGKPTCTLFGPDQRLDPIQRIYVINLDRQNNRWRKVRSELGRLRDRTGRLLTQLTRRFSAIDARYYKGPPNPAELLTNYTLADQLFVEPNPLLTDDMNFKNQHVEMTPQEVAVALSHIGVWKTVAESDASYTLVLEDDVYFRRGFARYFEKAWVDLMQTSGQNHTFDILYMSYKEVQTQSQRKSVSDLVFRPNGGLWQLSGYVLSKQGAEKLLDLLPVRGPVDLWINHQFNLIDVFATQKSIVEQRPDCPSANSYSILPILTKVGALTNERPLQFKQRDLPVPVFAFGMVDSGLTALAMALSMLGYRCCSDIAQLPSKEHNRLIENKKGRVFDAYVNIGSFTPRDYVELAKKYPRARFIITVSHIEDESTNSVDSDSNHSSGLPFNRNENRPVTWISNLQNLVDNLLFLPNQHPDKWELLRLFLGCEYPTAKYPEFRQQTRRNPGARHPEDFQCSFPPATRLKGDTSPWIAEGGDWNGIVLADSNVSSTHEITGGSLPDLDGTHWYLREDTFPSNLAIFTKNNYSVNSDSVVKLSLRKEPTSVREYTSASICSRKTYLYGKFVAELRPSNISGTITGMFLHRNSPRQEIDIEFLGKDTTKVLINVYYNPGDEGARMEYGFRGTPALVDLGFDASKDFHRYEIEWCQNSIRWYVDGCLACERVNWDPTPIPHLPLEFNVNLWHSRSIELAGKLSDEELPAQTEIRTIEVYK